MEKVIVTRHPALVDELKERFPELNQSEVLEHATEDNVEGKHVYGILPLRLAAKAHKITEVTLSLPMELRGKELTREHVKNYLTGTTTYTVHKVDEE